MDEMYYYAFCIGYDFMNDYFKNCEMPECDLVFEECKKLSREFIKSKEYKNTTLSAYEQLEIWLESNKEKIKENYIDFNPKKDRKDNMDVVEAKLEQEELKKQKKNKNRGAR